MLINITNTSIGYKWKLYDGPDGIDEMEGEEDSLGKAFESIIMHRTLIALSYREDASTKEN